MHLDQMCGQYVHDTQLRLIGDKVENQHGSL